jgi:hypothetical protein
MAPGLVGQTIEQAAGHPRMRPVGSGAKIRPQAMDGGNGNQAAAGSVPSA